MPENDRRLQRTIKVPGNVTRRTLFETICAVYGYEWRANPDFSVEGTIDAWRDRGAPGRKLVLGIPYYGQGWTGITAGGNGLFAPATGGAPGRFAVGTEDYKTLKNLPAQGFTVLSAKLGWVAIVQVFALVEFLVASTRGVCAQSAYAVDPAFFCVHGVFKMSGVGAIDHEIGRIRPGRRVHRLDGLAQCLARRQTLLLRQPAGGRRFSTI